MTSSPGPTPATSKARCRAVVQLETAQAWRAPVKRANSVSKAATCGPCVSQPESTTAAAASASSRPIKGCAIGITQATFDSCSVAALGPPPVDELGKPILKRNRGLEADGAAREAGVGKTARHRIDGALLAMDWIDVRPAHDMRQVAGDGEKRRLGAAADIERDVGGRRDRGQDVGARHVAHVQHVHRLLAVAENDGRLAGFETLHPAHQNLRVATVDVHARPVDVEVAQADVVGAVHVVEGAQEAFAERLGGAIEGAVVVGVVLLGRREGVGHAVDRRRGRHDDLAHAGLLALFDQIERRLDHDLERGARLGGAMGDAQRRLMEDGVGAVDEICHQLRVPDVADDHLDLARLRHRIGEIFGPSAHHIVDDNDLGASRIDEQIDDVRSDEPGAAGDEDALALQQIADPAGMARRRSFSSEAA